jgi:hypothetical protein
MQRKVIEKEELKAQKWDGIPKQTKTSQIREITMKQYAQKLLDATPEYYKLPKANPLSRSKVGDSLAGGSA